MYKGGTSSRFGQLDWMLKTHSRTRKIDCIPKPFVFVYFLGTWDISEENI